MNKLNYQRELDNIISENAKAGAVPSLFLHCCCAPCSSYCLEYLSQFFSVTAFYYNPNITDLEEYEKRERELLRLIREQPHLHEVGFVSGGYDPDLFLETARGYEGCMEGGERCFRCFDLRLRETAKRAAEGGYDYFTTTLTISPLKNAQKLNEIGMRLADEYGVKWLPSDFKKKGGYQRSIELSREYDLYRQNYCGCVYSVR
ncbi:MAG: epoxyqueuosine reductase QueH [Lachnospiraceae bacterium]|nr:epoxyqueuosine reductase QueH [Lachnospiraceae bacterium]